MIKIEIETGIEKENKEEITMKRLKIRPVIYMNKLRILPLICMIEPGTL